MDVKCKLNSENTFKFSSGNLSLNDIVMKSKHGINNDYLKKSLILLVG